MGTMVKSTGEKLSVRDTADFCNGVSKFMKKYLDNVRCVAPLIHNITNYVTANDVANVLLACGASPIMADEEAEVEEITTHCMGLI